jgi:molybdate transport system permease protein
MSIQPKTHRNWLPGRLLLFSLALLLWFLLVLPLLALIWRTSSFDVLAATSSPAILTSVLLSLRTTLISMIVILITGTPLAYVIAYYEFPFKRFMMLFIEMPIVIPPVIAGLALLSTFGRSGLLGQLLDVFNISIPFTTTAVVIAQVFVSAPFYIRAAQTSFESVDHEIQEAAAVDGANQWVTFWRILLPISLSSLFVGMMLSWARALGEFGATILFAGNLQGRTQTMPLLIYSRLESDLGGAFLTALILLGFAFISFALTRLVAFRIESRVLLNPLSMRKSRQKYRER